MHRAICFWWFPWRPPSATVFGGRRRSAPHASRVLHRRAARAAPRSMPRTQRTAQLTQRHASRSRTGARAQDNADTRAKRQRCCVENNINKFRELVPSLIRLGTNSSKLFYGVFSSQASWALSVLASVTSQRKPKCHNNVKSSTFHRRNRVEPEWNRHVSVEKPRRNGKQVPMEPDGTGDGTGGFLGKV